LFDTIVQSGNKQSSLMTIPGPLRLSALRHILPLQLQNSEEPDPNHFHRYRG
jgi:hypothetical protein